MAISNDILNGIFDDDISALERAIKYLTKKPFIKG